MFCRNNVDEENLSRQNFEMVKSITFHLVNSAYGKISKDTFDWKNINALKSLGAICVMRYDISESIYCYETKLTSSFVSLWTQ